jgi:hypothetical protein
MKDELYEALGGNIQMMQGLGGAFDPLGNQNMYAQQAMNAQQQCPSGNAWLYAERHAAALRAMNDALIGQRLGGCELYTRGLVGIAAHAARGPRPEDFVTQPVIPVGDRISWRGKPFLKKRRWWQRKAA